LRQEVGFPHPTKTGLNLGDADWAIEFWYLPLANSERDGVVFEVGEGPRGENDRVTQLLLSSAHDGFVFWSQPSGTRLKIPYCEKVNWPCQQHHLIQPYWLSNQWGPPHAGGAAEEVWDGESAQGGSDRRDSNSSSRRRMGQHARHAAPVANAVDR